MNRRQTSCPTRRSSGAILARNQTGFCLMAPKRKALTLKSLGHQVLCLLFSFLLRGILMTPEYESQHMGDNVGTHKHYTAKGPAFNYQDAEGGLQIRLLRQVLR